VLLTNHVETDYVSTRRFGDIAVTVIDEARGVLPIELTGPDGDAIQSIPGADQDGRSMSGFHVVHILAGGASILVDAGLDDADSAWGQRFNAEWPTVSRTPGLTAGLAEIGRAPDDITHVLITHVHFDHIAGLTVARDGKHAPRFRNAEVYLGRGDWERNSAREDPESELSVRVGTIERHNLLRLVDADVEVAPGVTILPAPGESPGHCIVRVSSRGETFFALGDLFHHTSEVQHLDWAAPWVDKPTMVASRQRLLRETNQTSATLVYSHHPFPPWGTAIETEDRWQWALR
jgi:glyoxylase-like metal-dependent hydrolase (beta-lactamase superfamily II)